MGLEGFVSFLGMGARILREIWAKRTFLSTWECNSKRRKLAYHFRSCFSKKKQFRLYYGVSHRGAARDESGDFAPRILALYMRFNGTGIWGGETICVTWLFHGDVFINIITLYNNSFRR